VAHAFSFAGALAGGSGMEGIVAEEALSFHTDMWSRDGGRRRRRRHMSMK
jgi:hypothetical protein